MDKLDDVIFYVLEKSIKAYRQFAQQQISASGLDITIDQWLIMKNIMENPTITQVELGKKVFKDNASVARIIALLVKNGYLERKEHDDRRRSKLKITARGKKIIAGVHPIVLKNRNTALKEIGKKEIVSLEQTLTKITENCIKV